MPSQIQRKQKGRIFEEEGTNLVSSGAVERL
jgi:hypothetical protein